MNDCEEWEEFQGECKEWEEFHEWLDGWLEGEGNLTAVEARLIWKLGMSVWKEMLTSEALQTLHKTWEETWPSKGGTT